MQTIAITEAKMSDLISFFNANAIRLQDGVPVKKFADRKTAERRVNVLVEKLASYFNGQEGEVFPPEGMIFVGELETDEGEKIELKASEVKPVARMELNGDDSDEDEELNGADVNSFASMGKVIGSMTEKEAAPARVDVGRASNSLGVALSWNDPQVRAERLTRDGVSVSVGGAVAGVYKSTREAFRAFKLPDSKHIRFRLKLKDARVADFEWQGKVYTFEIVAVEVE